MTQKNPTKMEKDTSKNALLVTSCLIAIGLTCFYFVLCAQEPDLASVLHLECLWGAGPKVN